VVEQDLVNQVRECLIKELENAMKIYGPNWVNKGNCAQIVEDLKNKQPTRIEGPFYGDYLDGVLSDMGIRSRDGTGKYEAILSELEKALRI